MAIDEDELRLVFAIERSLRQLFLRHCASVNVLTPTQHRFKSFVIGTAVQIYPGSQYQMYMKDIRLFTPETRYFNAHRFPGTYLCIYLFMY